MGKVGVKVLKYNINTKEKEGKKDVKLVTWKQNISNALTIVKKDQIGEFKKKHHLNKI